VDSSLAYQGAGRRLGSEAIRAINEFATGALVPDVTLLLAIDPGLGRRRSAERQASADRLELEDDGFFARVAAGYADLAAAEPRRIRTIDAAQATDVVLAEALAALDESI
jgi:dTMP kinase